MDLLILQSESARWRDRNFPDHSSTQAFLGMMEEMGEMAHAILKTQQGIRGWDEDRLHDELKDGLADWIIFACGFATNHGINLDQAVVETWDKVKERDWVAYPEKGVPDVG